MSMTRRGLFQWVSSLFAARAAEPEPPAPVACLTPAYAGFDGSFILNSGRYRIVLASALVDSPKRYSGCVRGMLGVWKNHDKSVSRLVYRNLDGKLFSLEFVPMDEPKPTEAP